MKANWPAKFFEQEMLDALTVAVGSIHKGKREIPPDEVQKLIKPILIQLVGNQLKQIAEEVARRETAVLLLQAIKDGVGYQSQQQP